MTTALEVTPVDAFGPVTERLKPIRRVPNAIFRVRFTQLRGEEGLTLNDVAMRLGWTRGGTDTRPDASRVEKTLGLRPERSGRGGHVSATRKRVTVSYELAVQLAAALDLDPYEAGV